MKKPRGIRVVSWLMLWTVLLELVPQGHLLAGSDIRVENVIAQIEGEKIVIMYDLIGNPADSCRVTLRMLKKGAPTYLYVPHSGLTGAIGDGQLPAKGKSILWEMRQEFPDGLVDEGYYFEIEAELLTKPESGSNFWLYAGGTVLVVGGLVALLLIKGSDDSTKVEVPNIFPAEPGRP